MRSDSLFFAHNTVVGKKKTIKVKMKTTGKTSKKFTVKASKKKIEKTRDLLKKEIKELTSREKKKLKKQGVDVEKLEQEGATGKVEDVVNAKVEVKEPEPSKEEKLLTEIRDLLAGKYIQSTVVVEDKAIQNPEENPASVPVENANA